MPERRADRAEPAVQLDAGARLPYIKDPKRSDYNMPTQRAVEQGLFEIKETTVVHSDGHTSINKTPKVTGKGQIYFVNQFVKR